MSVERPGEIAVDGLLDDRLTLARLARPTARTPTRVAVVADAHLTPTASGGWKALHRSEQRLRAAVSTVVEAGADGVLLLGDMTSGGEAAEFEVLDELLADLSVPCVAVPGNLDVPAGGDVPVGDRLGERYGRGPYPFRVDVGDVSLLCLDSASGAADTSESGSVSRETVEWLAETLPGVRSPIVAMHHNLSRAARLTAALSDRDRRVANADALRETLEARGGPLVLTGHLHWPGTTEREGVREVVAPSTCSFPPAVLLLDVTPWGTTVRLVPVAGRRGLSEAYDLARTGDDHSKRLAALADAGYFETLPLVDERNASERVGDDVPSSLRWR